MIRLYADIDIFAFSLGRYIKFKLFSYFLCQKRFEDLYPAYHKKIIYTDIKVK